MRLYAQPLTQLLDRSRDLAPLSTEEAESYDHYETVCSLGATRAICGALRELIEGMRQG